MWVICYTNNLIEMGLPDKGVIPDDDYHNYVIVIIKDLRVTIKMPMDNPLRSPYIYYMDTNGKRIGYNLSDWNSANGT